jgi:2-iminobutanoate/2-iminopropanoate deaminase
LRVFLDCPPNGQSQRAWAFLLQRLSFRCAALEGTDLHKPLTPQGIHPPFSNYNHGIEIVSRSRLVFCSGQVGISADADIPADCAGQAQICFENIRATLSEAGMGFEHVIKLNAYVTGREHLKAYMEVRNALFTEPYPASTLMIVSGFARPDFVVEIEAIAAAPG